MIIVMMGVSGSGKTLVGSELARSLRWQFVDADDYHSKSSVEKMRSGVPLDDRDRKPWLAALKALLLQLDAQQISAVLACSSLRRDFRRSLSDRISELHFVFLAADQQLLSQRLRERRGHFMPATLLASQFAALEHPHEALVLDAFQTVSTLVEQVQLQLNVSR